MYIKIYERGFGVLKGCLEELGVSGCREGLQHSFELLMHVGCSHLLDLP